MKGQTLAEAITTYLRDGNLSQSTRVNVERVLNRFSNEIGVGKRINRITHTDVSDYIEDHLRTRGLAPNSLWQYVAQIKGFFTFCVKARFIPYSPSEMIHVSRVPEDPDVSKGIPHDLLIEMLDYSLKNCYRDYAMMAVLMCGLRRKGVAGLKLNRINWEKGEVTVLDKGSRYNTYVLSDSAMSALDEYIHHHRKVTTDDHVFITVRTPYKHLEVASVSYAVFRLCMKAGAEKAYGPHTVRHWFTEMLRQMDTGELTIRDALNHQSEDTTQKHYARRNRSKVHQAVDSLDANLRRQIDYEPMGNIIRYEDLVS
jgi:site-specific recombinase XerD